MHPRVRGDGHAPQAHAATPLLSAAVSMTFCCCLLLSVAVVTVCDFLVLSATVCDCLLLSATVCCSVPHSFESMAILFGSLWSSGRIKPWVMRLSGTHLGARASHNLVNGLQVRC